MTTIKTGLMKIERKKHDIVSAQLSMEEIHIKFADGITIIIPWHDTDNINRMNAILNMFKTSKGADITLDLTNKNQPLSIG